jgi:hypothetical protein
MQYLRGHSASIEQFPKGKNRRMRGRRMYALNPPRLAVIYKPVKKKGGELFTPAFPKTNRGLHELMWI